MVKINKKGYFRPNKRLGQHFLTDQDIILQILDKSRMKPTDHVLEIGSGMGALTIPLSRLVKHVTAVEKDSRLADYLERKIIENQINNVTVIKNDILKTDIKELTAGDEKKIKVMGNLPYNISSPLLEKLILNKTVISRAVLMFQYEFARRLSAAPGNKSYGAITVMTRYDSHVSQLLEVGRNMFYPRPKVGSMVLEIDMERPHPVRAVDDRILRLVVKGAFAQRRKTIKNSLRVISHHFSMEDIELALEKCNIEPIRRAETLELDEFLCLSDTLRKVRQSA